MTHVTLPRTVVEQALEALEWSWGGEPLGTLERDAITTLRAALAQQAEPVQDQDVEDAIEAAYWQFDCRRSGLNEWASAPQSERDAFKAEARKLVRGYFPTRQAQDTKREMLAVADAFIRGKRAALAQQAEPTPPDATAGLVDDLCLLQLGWVSDAEGVLHRAAMGRVIARATEVRRLRKIEQLKAQVAQMEGNT